MSYILEALRRAEAERQRGAVPGLHAQPASTALADAGLPVQPDRPDRWRRAGLAAAALVLVAASLVWLLTLTLTPTPTPTPTPTVPPALVAAVPPVAPVPPAPALAPSVLSVPSPVAPAQAVAPRLPPAAILAAPAAAPAPAPAARPVPVASSPPARLPTLAELPDALRRELPALSLGGAVYAEQATQRMVIVNGQVLREGDRLNADLQVQEIRLKSVVFSLRGQRFEMPM
jgi:general secretion pathway protein B